MGRFAVLAVCTANICRSPVMEHLLREGLPGDAFEVASAGVQGYEGYPVDPDAAACLTRYGIDSSAFRSRHLEPFVVESADLVLTATREHRAGVLALSPRALRRTFTLVEFADLVGRVESDTVAGLVAEAARHRSLGPSDVDIDDPFRRGPVVHQAVAERIHEAVSRVTDVIAGFARSGEPLRIR